MMAHTLDAIADGCDVSLRTVQQWIADGELRAVNVSRSRTSRKPRLRVLDADLQAFLAGRSVGMDPPQRRSGRRRKPVKQYV